MSVVVSGCAPRLLVTVDSISGVDAAGTKYKIISGLKDVRTDGLQFQEYAAYLRRALAISGYSEVKGSERAEILVSLSYGISAPEDHIDSTLDAVTTQNPGSTYNYSGWANGGYSSGTVHEQPSYSTSYVPSVTTYTTFTRMILIGAFDPKPIVDRKGEKNFKKLWETTIASTGASGDLRTVFPVLIAVSVDLIGKNTHGQVKRTIRLSDPEVALIRGQGDQDNRVPASVR